MLASTPKGLFYSNEQMSYLSQIRSMYEAEAKSTMAFPTTGNRRLLCILIAYTDKAFTRTQAEFHALFNQVNYTVGGATGSVKDYYLQNSYNQFNLTVDVAGPYTASNTLNYYGANDANDNDLRPRELVTEAVNLADADTVNFALYDNDSNGSVDGIYVIYAGYGEDAGAAANTIWAHAWSIPTVYKDGKSVVSTSHEEASVTSPNMMKRYDEKNMLFKVHSHPGADGTKGASVSTVFRDDMNNIIDMAHSFNKAGIYTEKNFPKHFIYHPDSKGLYQYTPYNSSVFLGIIGKKATLNKRILNSKSPFFNN